MSAHRVVPALAAALLAALSGPAAAEDCRLALVLALDTSSSVNNYEDRLQREGLASALLDPEVVRVFLSAGPVALYVFEWSGPLRQVTLSPGWQIIESEDDLVRMAASIASSAADTNRTGRETALGSALIYAATALNGGPDCRARTVDIAGDGPNNQGIEPATVYGDRALHGVTVNALVVGGAQISDDDLVAWFEAEVLHGPGAFWILAHGYADYERAMQTKLLRELQVPMVSGSPQARVAG